MKRKIRHFFAIFTIIFCAVFFTSSFLVGCVPSKKYLENPQTASDFKLDTFVQVSIFDDVDKSLALDTLALCDKYENLFSMYDKNSILWQVNHNETDIIPADLGKAINEALILSKKSNGAFQISIGAVSYLWDFSSGKKEVPNKDDIKKALASVDDSKISVFPIDKNNVDGNWKIVKEKDTMIDLGAVAKGYIADRLKEFLISHSVTSAIINLGGNVLCVGNKKNVSDFNIGVQKPFATNGETSFLVSVNDSSVVSSGIYERYFKDENGNFYHHILNPKTGYPYDDSLSQVTILSKDSLNGDCLSTICFALGLDKGMKLINSIDGVEAIFITKDEKTHFSEGAKKYAIL